MTWNLSTFRQAGIQTALLFYGFSVFLGIAIQHMDLIAAESQTTYLLCLAGISGMIIYANAGMGWSIPRPVFFILTGAASIYAMNTFLDTGVVFAMIILSALIICGVFAIVWVIVDRRLSISLARTNKHKQKKE